MPPSLSASTEIPRFLKWLLGRRVCLVGVLLLLALFFRLWHLPDSRFCGDEASFYATAQKVIEQGEIPALGGPVSGGAARFPGGTFFLVMALPLLLARSPYACMLLVVLLNLLAAWLLYQAFRRQLGERSGLLFLVLFLFNPWAVFYSDRIWLSNVTLVFSALVIWSWTRVLATDRSRQAFWLAFALVLSFQVHLSVILLWVLVAAWWLLAKPRPRLNWRFLGLGAGAASLLYLPYLVHELRTGFHNTRLLASMGSDGGYSAWEPVRSLWQMISFASGELSYLAAQGYWFSFGEGRFYLEEDGLSRVHGALGGDLVAWLLLGCMLLAVLLALLALVRFLGGQFRGGFQELRSRPLAQGLLVALVFSPLLLWLGRKQMHPHYVSVLWPLCLVPVLSWAEDLLGRRPRLHAPLVGLLVGLALGQAWSSSRIYANVERKVSLGEQNRILDTLYQWSGDKPFRLEFWLEHARLDSYPIEELARTARKRPLPVDRRAEQLFAVEERDHAPSYRAPDHRFLGLRTIGATAVIHAERN